MSLRSIVSVDLKELGEAFQKHCELQNMGRMERADFIRNALAAAIKKPVGRTAVRYRKTSGAGPRKVVKTTIAPSAYDRLVEAAERSGATSMAHYLESVAEQAQVVPLIHKVVEGRKLAPEAMQAISTSNLELSRIGHNVNQIAKSLHIHPGKTTPQDEELLRGLTKLVKDHTERIAWWLLEQDPPRAPRNERGGPRRFVA